jgi:1-acyl-sn-glycerol-3-phosphate acyltransferase
MPIRIYFLKRIVDLLVTLIIWIYYILGFLLFFSPLYLAAFIFSSNREIAFQRLNNLYYRSFFCIVRAMVPGLKIRVQDAVTSIRSSVIVCNHLSYLDPILLISLFPKHKTIVKGIFFKIPVFGWMLKTSGYIPSSVGGMASSGIIENMERMGDYLSSGGNLFIFPEGTRSRNGKIGKFNDGAFKIARRFGAPITVLRIKNTNGLFAPGKFLFNTCNPNTIEVRLIEDLNPDYKNDAFSISGLVKQVRSLYI